MERTDTVLLCLCIAAEGDISQMYCALNGMNRYSTAVFVAALVRKYFVLDLRKKESRPPDLLKRTPEFSFIAWCKWNNILMELNILCGGVS
jgi:hypothetical protein